MSSGPDKVPYVLDLFEGSGATTGTRAGSTFTLPSGKKAVQVSFVTSATATVKIQNSIDGTTWFDVSSSTVSPGVVYEVDSAIPKWRVNVTAHTTSGTGTASLVAQIAYDVPK